jgi:poly-gamma-glutamate synthesis protein (capsule biosynthesis protein)
MGESRGGEPTLSKPGIVAEAATLPAGAPALLRISLCGDVMTGRGIDQVLPHPCPPHLYESYVRSALRYVELAEEVNGPIPRPVPPDYVWGDALEDWRRARPHVRIANLETSITRSEAHARKGIHYRMSPENAECLRPAELDCCVLANNHVLDWGRPGLIDTLDALGRLGVQAAGAGRDADEAGAPAVLETPRGRVIVLALGTASSGVPEDWAAGPGRSGVCFLDELSPGAVDEITDLLRGVRKPGDVVVVSIHWGDNWGHGIPPGQESFARALIDRAGVAIVHGHSSHHAKAIEVYRGCLILYGCGDFLTDYEGIGGYEAYRGDLSVLYLADVRPGGELASLRMVPLQMRRFRLRRPSASDVAWLARTLDRVSARFGASVRADGDALHLSWLT